MLKLARRARGHFVTLIEIRVHLIRVKPWTYLGKCMLNICVPDTRTAFKTEFVMPGSADTLLGRSSSEEGVLQVRVYVAVNFCFQLISIFN